MATQSRPVGNVSRASAITTLIRRIPGHVTPELVSASSACTTLMALPVPTVNRVTMAMLWPMIADVSDVSTLECIDKNFLRFISYYLATKVKV